MHSIYAILIIVSYLCPYYVWLQLFCICCHRTQVPLVFWCIWVVHVVDIHVDCRCKGKTTSEMTWNLSCAWDNLGKWFSYESCPRWGLIALPGNTAITMHHVRVIKILHIFLMYVKQLTPACWLTPKQACYWQ